MKKEKSKALSLLFRYSLLLFFGIFSSNIFYFLFTLLTLYPVFFLLKLFFINNVSLISNLIFIGKTQIEIVGACVASSAYFLLLMLNLSTPNIKPLKRIGILLANFGIFLIFNILRIFFLSILLVKESPMFDLAHKLFWYVLSTFFVISIWFLTVKLAKIQEIPFYSDIKFLIKNPSKLNKKIIKKFLLNLNKNLNKKNN